MKVVRHNCKNVEVRGTGDGLVAISGVDNIVVLKTDKRLIVVKKDKLLGKNLLELIEKMDEIEANPK